ncbi:MAG: PaaI family thioesterase [Bacteroidia bacterium]
MQSTEQRRFKSRNPEFRALIARKLEGQEFMRHIGFELTEINEAYIEGEVGLHKFLQQQDGMVHGGVTATLADIVCGFAAFSLVEPHQCVVTADLKISYFSPGRGVKVKARGWVVKPGKKLHFCEGEVLVVDAEGGEQVIAKASAIMAVLTPRERGENSRNKDKQGSNGSTQ